MTNIYKKLSAYTAVGIATTLVNWRVYFVMTNQANAPVLISNGTAWVVAVVFSYIFSRKYVFLSQNPKIFSEFFSFSAGRAFSGIIESLFLWVLIDAAHLPNAPVKIAASMLSMVLNYVISNSFVFRKPAGDQK